MFNKTNFVLEINNIRVLQGFSFPRLNINKLLIGKRTSI